MSCFYLCLVLVGTTSAFAQLSRDEKKALKKEIRKMDPEDLKALKEQLKGQEQQIDSLKAKALKLKAVEEMMANQKMAMQTLQEKYDQLEEDYTSVMMEKAHEELHEEEWNHGVVFRVQIGALTQKEYEKEIPSDFAMEVEKNDNMQKMLIGYYRDYEEANTFKKLMRKIGISTAWIVPYKDGKRVKLHEVMDQVVE
ncbi:SPOR domain-containing protein [Echinicola jeungdonensis]|uniref:SPOR domain-containing protein n=1 Tax=Echinicola jeungdonensis TaxID=709343 RepID=UPI0025B4F7BE|nr:SPOR domain-containing protein [Echinicola jeungdonensis]MDN3668887.1 SPOR domain-containing protein [Echinicola jeungdonensis]